MEICELCGDDILPEDESYEINDLYSEYFCLDSGTLVHKSCFLDSKPSGLFAKDCFDEF